MSWDDNPTSRLSAPFRGTKLQPWQPSCWDPGLVLGCKTPILELPALFVGCIALGYLFFFFFALQNAALFWWNLRRNGDGDGDTLHAGCPVLAGDKWGEWQHPVSPHGDAGSEGQQGGHPLEVGIGDRDGWGPSSGKQVDP